MCGIAGIMTTDGRAPDRKTLDALRAALAAALRRVGAEAGLARRLADGGRAAYDRSYSEGVVVRSYMDLFERLAG